MKDKQYIHNVYGRLVLVLNRWSEKQLKKQLN